MWTSGTSGTPSVLIAAGAGEVWNRAGVWNSGGDEFRSARMAARRSAGTGAGLDGETGWVWTSGTSGSPSVLIAAGAGGVWNRAAAWTFEGCQFRSARTAARRSAGTDAGWVGVPGVVWTLDGSGLRLAF